jgi:hypothetical protein
MAALRRAFRAHFWVCAGIAGGEPDFGGEDFDRYRSDPGNETTVKQWSDDAPVAVFAMTSTRLSGAAIFGAAPVRRTAQWLLHEIVL